MSLLNRYGDANKQTSTGLCVRYSCEEDSTYSGWFVYTRYASKTYSYVGMDYDTAKACAAAKRTQYLRRHNRVTIEATGGVAVSVCAKDTQVYEALCTISMVHGEGDSWDVEIQVNETESRASQSASTSPESLFSSENGWDYDEGAAAASEIAITEASATAGGTTITTKVTSTRTDFTPWGSVLSVSCGTSSDTYVCKAASGESGTWSATWGGSLALAAEPTSVKVTFGAASSNTFTFTPAEKEA